MPQRHVTTNAAQQRAKLGSDIVLADGWGFLSELLPIDLGNDGTPLPEMVEDQTRKILANLETVLRSAGLGKESVVSVRIALVDMKRFYERMNSAYGGFFPADRLPARSCVGVSQLPRGALVAMDVVVRAPAA